MAIITNYPQLTASSSQPLQRLQEGRKVLDAAAVGSVSNGRGTGLAMPALAPADLICYLVSSHFPL